MNIRSLLLGSAAALVAASGAKAADAIVVPESEPMEYVRVCDAFGAGFFYIPGTETCLSINGYVWFQVAGDTRNTVEYDDNEFTLDDYESGNYPEWSTRIRINLDTRSDTEWGTLRGFVRIQADWNAQNQAVGVALYTPTGEYNSNYSLFAPGDGNAIIDQAFLELGGFRAGYTDSGFNQTQAGGASNWGSHSWDGMAYAYQQRHLIAYSFTGGNGVHATLSLEDDGNANWMPDIVAVAGINQGWGGVWVKGAYDEDVKLGVSYTPLYTPESGEDGWAASVGGQFNIPNMNGSSLRVIGFYADNANAYSVGSEWSVLASYYHVFSPTLSGSIAAQYFANTDFDTAGDPNAWRGELSIVWAPVTNFEVRTELFYDKAEDEDGETSGFLRFTRYF